MAQNNEQDDDIFDENYQIMDYTWQYTINYFNLLYKFFDLLFRQQ